MGDEYDDEYATCESTYATFRIFHADLDPERTSQDLRLHPTNAFRRGEVMNPGSRSQPVIARQGGWLLSTKEAVTSRDIRRHLDWLIDRLSPHQDVIQELRSAGCQMDVFCYWRWTGQGGPTLSPRNMVGLGRLGIELGFDIYQIPRSDEDEAPD